LKNPFACGTQAKTAFCGRFSLAAGPLPGCRLRKRHAGCPQQCGRRGRGVSPSVPHAPSAKRNRDDRQTLGPEWTRGDEVCLRCHLSFCVIASEARQSSAREARKLKNAAVAATSDWIASS